MNHSGEKAVKISQIVSITAFFLVLVLLPVLTLCLPKRSFSPEENRDLATPPALRFDTWQDRSFMDGTEQYMADHFLGRTSWVEAKGLTQKLLGDREIGGVFLCGDRFVSLPAALNDGYFERNLLCVSDFAAVFGCKPVVAVVPDAATLMSDLLPPFAPVPDRAEAFATIKDRLSASSFVVDLNTPLAKDPQNYYYRTDHHLTSEGAYRLYLSLAEALGYTPLVESDFVLKEGCEPFLGSLYSKCLIQTGIQSDRVVLWQPKEAQDVSVFDGDGKKLSDSVFFEEYLSEKDQYLVFLGLNRNLTVVENKSLANGKTLVILKDSYANALTPFLSMHYEKIILVDPRYYRGEMQEIMPSEGDVQVLFLFGAESFFTQNHLGRLLF